MENKLYTTINNYEIYTVLSDECEVILKRESFQVALQRLVDALNGYTKAHTKGVVHTLLENELDDIASNQYVYFDVSAATVGEKDPHIYVFRFTWKPIRSIEINQVRMLPVSSIGLFTGCVRWENNDFYATYPVEFNDDITYSRWKESNCVFKQNGYFHDLNEYLFHIFRHKFHDYINSLAYLGYTQKEGITTDIQQIANIFWTASGQLSKYPKGIIYNSSKGYSKVDWFYNALDAVFNELDKDDKMDASFFYIAMRDYVKHIEDTRMKGDTKEN